VPSFESSTLKVAAAQKPAARISPTSRGFVITAVIVALVSFASSFLISGHAQVWVGEQLGLDPMARFAVPLAFDAPMVAFGLSSISRRARGERITGSLAWLAAFALISIGANTWHVLATSNARGFGVIGLVAVSAFTPIGVLATSEQILGILVAPPTASREQLAALQRVADRGQLATQAVSGRAAKRGTPEAEDLAEVVRSAHTANPTISKTALAQQFGLSATRIREILNSAPA
jgi:hypothetical protein